MKSLSSLLVSFLLFARRSCVMAQSTNFFVDRFPRNAAFLEADAVDFEVTIQSSPQVEIVELELRKMPDNQTEAPLSSIYEMAPVLTGSQQAAEPTIKYHYRHDFLTVGKYCWLVTARLQQNLQSSSTVGSMGSWVTCFEMEEPEPSSSPSHTPSIMPTMSLHPSAFPSYHPTASPTKEPTKNPTKAPVTAAPVQPTTYTLRVAITKDQYYDADNTAWRMTKNGNTIRYQKTSAVMQITPGLYCYSMEDEWGDGIQAGGGYSVKVDDFTVLSGRQFKFSTGQLCFRVGSNGGVQRKRAPSNSMCGSNDGQNFNICIETVDLSRGVLLNNGLMNKFQNGFLAAKQKWESVLVGDDGRNHWTPFGLPVDDVTVMAVAKSIDGVGNVLAFASPSLTKTINGKVRAYTGYMVFDSEDIPNLINGQTFNQVAAHELGHILGIGSLWKENNLFDKDIPGDKYKGSNANREFRKYLSSYGGLINPNDQSITLPIESGGGAGTAGSHFDENCLNHEIMTGFLDQHNRMSKITIGALEDLGFTVNYDSADDYRMPTKRVQNCMDIINGNRMLRSSQSSARRIRLLQGPSGDNPNPQDVADAEKSGQEYIHRCKKSLNGVELKDDEMDVGCSHISVIFQGESGSLFGMDVFDEESIANR